MSIKNRLFSWMQATMMILAFLSVLSLTEMPASAAEAVEYLSPIYVNSSDPTKGVSGWETKTITSYKTVNSDDEVWYGGWYVVASSAQVDHHIKCRGDVKLILLDGVKLSVKGADGDAGITVEDDHSLTIYAQSTDTDTMGRLIANGGADSAGIGGDKHCSGNNITINGGYVEATGGKCAAGIGSGSGGFTRRYGHDIVINGGYKFVAKTHRLAYGMKATVF